MKHTLSVTWACIQCLVLLKVKWCFLRSPLFFSTPPMDFLGKKTGTGSVFWEGDVHRIPHIEVAHQAVEERLLQRWSVRASEDRRYKKSPLEAPEIPIKMPSMGRVRYIYRSMNGRFLMVKYGKFVGKYTSPMDASWDKSWMNHPHFSFVMFFFCGGGGTWTNSKPWSSVWFICELSEWISHIIVHVDYVTI